MRYTRQAGTASTQVLLLLLLPPAMLILTTLPVAHGKAAIILRPPDPMSETNDLAMPSPVTETVKPKENANTDPKTIPMRSTGPRRSVIIRDMDSEPEMPHPERSEELGNARNATTPNLGQITDPSTAADEATSIAPPDMYTAHAHRSNYDKQDREDRPPNGDVLNSYVMLSTVSSAAKTTAHQDERLTTAPHAGDVRTTRHPILRPHLAYFRFFTLYPPGNRRITPTSLKGHSADDPPRSYFTTWVIMLSVACFFGGVMLSATTTYCIYNRHCLKMADHDSRDEENVRRGNMHNTSLIYSFPPPNLDNPKANLLMHAFLTDIAQDKDVYPEANMATPNQLSLNEDTLSSEASSSLSPSNSPNVSRESTQELNSFQPDQT